MRRAFFVFALCAPLGALACSLELSELYGINVNAVVAQPDPPPVEAVDSQAVVDVGNASGCGESGCGDLSALEFRIRATVEGSIGFQFQILGEPEAPPSIAIGPLQAVEQAADGAYVVRVRWSSNDQYQSSALRMQVRTVNLKGEPGEWTEAFTVKPEPLDTQQTGGVGLGWLMGALLLGLGARRRR